MCFNCCRVTFFSPPSRNPVSFLYQPTVYIDCSIFLFTLNNLLYQCTNNLQISRSLYRPISSYVVPTVYFNCNLCSTVKGICSHPSAIIILTECFFIQPDFREIKKRLVYIAPIFSSSLLIVVIHFNLFQIPNESGSLTQSITSAIDQHLPRWASDEIPRHVYFLSQIPIIVTVYLKLFFYPCRQNIDHDFLIIDSFFNIQCTDINFSNNFSSVSEYPFLQKIATHLIRNFMVFHNDFPNVVDYSKFRICL